MKKIGILIRSENGKYENNYYINAVLKFGGEVILINDLDSISSVLDKVSKLDGILLTGGDEVGRLDFFLIEYAFNNNLKLLGICQGMQSMALYGSSDKLVEIGDLSHSSDKKYAHYVDILSNSRFYELIKKNRILVNSHHLQTISRSSCFNVVGKSLDGLIEVVENSKHIFQIGVQWHPERMLDYDEVSNIIIDGFVNL